MWSNSFGKRLVRLERTPSRFTSGTFFRHNEQNTKSLCAPIGRPHLQRSDTLNSGFVYIMTNPSRTTFYTGVTNNLLRRVSEHRNKALEGFTEKYNCTIIVYYEFHETIRDAIIREKQLKNWKREWKLSLIREINPELRDLWDEIRTSYR